MVICTKSHLLERRTNWLRVSTWNKKQVLTIPMFNESHLNCAYKFVSIPRPWKKMSSVKSCSTDLTTQSCMLTRLNWHTTGRWANWLHKPCTFSVTHFLIRHVHAHMFQHDSLTQCEGKDKKSVIIYHSLHHNQICIFCCISQFWRNMRQIENLD